MHGGIPRPNRVAIHDLESGKRDDNRKTPTVTSPRWNSATVPRFRKRRWAAFILGLVAMYLLFANLPEGMIPVNQRMDIRTPGRFVDGRPIPGQRMPQRPIQPPPAAPPAPGVVNPAAPPKSPIDLKPETPKPPPTKPKTLTPVDSLETPQISHEEEKVPIPKIPSKVGTEDEPIPKISGKTSKIPKPDDEGAGPWRYYNGEVEFPLLISSLQAIHSGRHYNPLSNVLFVASNLQSAAVLIPVVCEMASIGRSNVHFVYFGRDDLEMSVIQDINGAKGGCKALWHDGRPDFSLYSSDERFALAVREGLEHVHNYIHAESVLTVDPVLEEKAMIDVLHSLAATRQTSIIEIPSTSTDKLMWLTRLDATSISAWQKIDIKILIQVTKENGGSLFKLLKSLTSADYTGHRHPDITFEIPSDLDLPSESIVNQFVWPPFSKTHGPARSQITIRKRLSHQKITPLESSIRTVEAFYPSQPNYEHIMVLSPTVELSSMWYHYLMFNVLEYTFSPKATQHLEAGTLAGISLITPSTQVDGTTPLKAPAFSPPATFDPDLPKPTTETPNFVPFMWQYPDSTATLYLGNKWRELHSFLSLRLTSAGIPEPRKMPQNAPPFVEPLNELMQLRGWHVLYPNLPAHHLVTYRSTTATREEFIGAASDENEAPAKGKDKDPYTPSAPSAPSAKQGLSSAQDDIKTLANVPIHNAVPDNGVLPELRYMPILDNAANSVSILELLGVAGPKRDAFRAQHGGCPLGATAQGTSLTADDLFCDASGEPLSGSLPPPYDPAMNAPVSDPVAEKLAEEKRKDETLGDASVIQAQGEEKKKIMEEELFAHLQRQASAGEDSASGTTEKPAGW